MSLKEPNYTDEQGHVVHEGWDDGKLVFVEKSTLGDDKNHGYFERINYDANGKKIFRQLKTPTVFGFTTIEEHYDKGFLTSQHEEVDGKGGVIIAKIRQFYPQITPDGTHLDKEILRRETIINRTTGKVEEKEFDLTGEEMLPEQKKTPFSFQWKNKVR